MDVSIDFIRDKLNLGDHYVNQIQILLENDYDDFIKAFTNIYSGERLFVILSTVVIDICVHIVSHSHHITPFTYSECVLHLQDGDLDILPENLTNKIVEAVKMRNRLAHQYENIDSTTLYESLGKIIKDFRQFKERIEEKFEL